MKVMTLRMQDDLYEELDIFARALDVPMVIAVRKAINDWICTQSCDEEVVQKIRDKFGHDKVLIEKILGES